jgi:hypothetical protein
MGQKTNFPRNARFPSLPVLLSGEGPPKKEHIDMMWRTVRFWTSHRYDEKVQARPVNKHLFETM